MLIILGYDSLSYILHIINKPTDSSSFQLSLTLRCHDNGFFYEDDCPKLNSTSVILHKVLKDPRYWKTLIAHETYTYSYFLDIWY